ncbi:MAG: S-methyl-5-thioribose-1-phosphate isomerase [Eubacterium sp.]|jgi:methylthioribose-1-phosphate isomerase
MKVADILAVKYIDGKLFVLDQTLLPNYEKYIELKCKEDVWDAIQKLRVRGAPAIGVAAAYGLIVSVRNECLGEPYGKSGDDAVTGDNAVTYPKTCTVAEFGKVLKETADYLVTARPTAVNLSWAAKRMVAKFEEAKPQTAEEAVRLLTDEATKIFDEDVASCKSMGEYGLTLLKPGMGILTHCNAGTLATAKYGTCLAPIYLGQERGYDFHVFSDETRPLLQGARLTSWELSKVGIDVTLICDNMASIVMKNGWVDAVVVGCDRMAANGDGANKIGTSGVAILAKEYGIPFYMFVPTSTIDMDTPTGDDIHIELRDGDEIRTMWYEKPMAPEGVKTYNPSFDVTSAKYITAVVTEKGIAYPPYKESLAAIMAK